MGLGREHPIWGAVLRPRRALSGPGPVRGGRAHKPYPGWARTRDTAQVTGKRYWQKSTGRSSRPNSRRAGERDHGMAANRERVIPCASVNDWATCRAPAEQSRSRWSRWMWDAAKIPMTVIPAAIAAATPEGLSSRTNAPRGWNSHLLGGVQKNIWMRLASYDG